MRREGAEFFVLAVRCREVKEKFSLAMALDPRQVFRKAVGEYGRITGATWETFLERARPLPRPLGDLRPLPASDESAGRCTLG